MLTTLLVAGFGRSGTTALMSLLASSPRVAFDRVYPFERRYLAYFAKLALVLERQDPNNKLAGKRLVDFTDAGFGSYPWEAGTGKLTAEEWLRGIWGAFDTHLAQADPAASCYAEKAPPWLPAMTRGLFATITMYLFRDPRDLFLSTNSFMKKRNSLGFERLPEDTDLDYARTLAWHFLGYFENYVMERDRQDCMLVNYEAMVMDGSQLASQLNRHSGIEVHWESAPWLDAHRTTPDLSSSIARWQREPLPGDVDQLLCKLLGSEMVHLGYPVSAAQAAAPAAVEFRAGALDAADIKCSSDGTLTLQENASAAVITGPDFWMILPLRDFDAAPVQEIWVSVRGALGETCSIYWRNNGVEFSEDRSICMPYRGGAHWQVLRFRVAKHALWEGTIAELRLDLFNGREYSTAAPGIGFTRWLRLVE